MLQQIVKRPVYIRTLGVTVSRYVRHASIQALPREELLMNDKIRLRDRQYLPGSTGGGFPEFLAEPRESFPHGVQIGGEQSTVRDTADQCRAYIDKSLPEHGAILFRNLPMRTPDEFSVFVKKLGYEAATNEGGSAHREEVDANASTYTVSNEPPEMNIEMHNEMAYKAKFPRKVNSRCACVRAWCRLCVKGV